MHQRPSYYILYLADLHSIIKNVNTIIYGALTENSNAFLLKYCMILVAKYISIYTMI